jgi:hypothetical protein
MPGRGFRQSLEIKEPRATVQEDWQMRVTIIFELAVLTLCFAVLVFAAGPGPSWKPGGREFNEGRWESTAQG